VVSRKFAFFEPLGDHPPHEGRACPEGRRRVREDEKGVPDEHTASRRRRRRAWRHQAERTQAKLTKGDSNVKLAQVFSPKRNAMGSFWRISKRSVSGRGEPNCQSDDALSFPCGFPLRIPLRVLAPTGYNPASNYPGFDRVKGNSITGLLAGGCSEERVSAGS
jgi:hypothetical protein